MDWMLIDIVTSGTGTFRVPCDHCGSICRKRYLVLRNRLDGRTLNVGSNCSFALTGAKDLKIETEEASVVGDLPDWMM